MAETYGIGLGKENIQFFKEKSLKELLKRHLEDEDADIDHVEGNGADILGRLLQGIIKTTV